jgi:hypothetical protein
VTCESRNSSELVGTSNVWCPLLWAQTSFQTISNSFYSVPHQYSCTANNCKDSGCFFQQPLGGLRIKSKTLYINSMNQSNSSKKHHRHTLKKTIETLILKGRLRFCLRVVLTSSLQPFSSIFANRTPSAAPTSKIFYLMDSLENSFGFFAAPYNTSKTFRPSFLGASIGYDIGVLISVCAQKFVPPDSCGFNVSPTLGETSCLHNVNWFHPAERAEQVAPKAPSVRTERGPQNRVQRSDWTI